jgi:hypothetical protein
MVLTEDLCKLATTSFPDNHAVRLTAPLWLILGLSFVMMSNLLTVVSTLMGDTLAASTLRIAPPVAARLALAGLWMLLCATLLAGLLRRVPWAFRQCAPLLTVYGLSQWIWQLLFARADFDQGRLPFLLLATLLLLVPVWWLTLRRGWLRRPFANTGALENRIK